MRRALLPTHVDRTRPEQLQGWRTWAVLGLAGIAAATLGGCVSTTTTRSNAYPDGTLPVVSTDPQGDGSALQETKRQLTEVHWQVIERKGPHSIQEQFSLNGKKPTDPPAPQSQRPATPPTTQPPVIE